MRCSIAVSFLSGSVKHSMSSNQRNPYHNTKSCFKYISTHIPEQQQQQKSIIKYGFGGIQTEISLKDIEIHKYRGKYFASLGYCI